MFKNKKWDNDKNIQRDMCLLRATIYIGWVDRQTFLKRFILCWYLRGKKQLSTRRSRVRAFQAARGAGARPGTVKELSAFQG